jgi:putative ABC transport system permease protein
MSKLMPKSLRKSVRKPIRKPGIPRREIVSMAIQSLRNNRLRTALTMLGVIIGIASVIMVTSIGQGVQKSTEQQIQSLGSNVMLVLAGAVRSGGVSQGGTSASTLTWDDAQAVERQAPAAIAVTAFLQRPGQVVAGDKNVATTIYGADLQFPTVRNTNPIEGQYFEKSDLDSAQSVAILGSKTREDLFGSDPAIGENIRINRNRYRIIGVMEEKGSSGGQDPDDRVYVPLTNMSSRIVGNNAISGISISGMSIQAADANQLDAVQFQVSNLLRIRHNIYPPDPDDFRIINQVDIINAFTGIVSLFTVMIGAIAGISLIVGGIGIANIMLVSVVERTREIGIRKALGATSQAILLQFLLEAIVVSVLGGSVGIAVGISLTFVVTQIFKFPFIVAGWSVLVAFGLSAIVGLIAGVVPARNAAQLDPIVALRSE